MKIKTVLSAVPRLNTLGVAASLSCLVLAGLLAVLARPAVGNAAGDTETPLKGAVDLRSEIGIVSERRNAPPVRGIVHTLGDRIRITFYERVRLSSETKDAEGNSADPDAKKEALVERAELTGVYTIQETGAIVLPLLGSIDAEGYTSERVAAELEAAFKEVMGREAKVSLIVEEREPVYFIGRGSRSGTVKYVPGMTVLHAIARTSASDEQRGDVYVTLERLRERERLQKAREKLRPLLAREAVLTAERDGRDPETPERLIELLGPDLANKAVDAERRRRSVILESRKPVLQSFTVAVAVARQEKANLAAKLAIVDANIASRAEREEMVDTLKQRGSANGFLSAQVKSDLADIRERREDVKTALSAADLKISEAENNLERVEAEARAERERDMRALEDDIAEAEATISGSQRLIDDLEVSAFRATSGRMSDGFEIIRRTRSGPEHIMATETTELRPGDLVRVIETASPDIVSR